MNRFLTLLVVLSVLAVSTTATLAVVGNTLKAGKILPENFIIKAATLPYYALLQGDGNFVIYKSAAFGPHNAIFSTKTAGKGQAPYHLTLQTDGNLVIYDATNVALWDTNTAGEGAGGWFLTMQDDGNLVLYDSTGKALWDSKGGVPSNAGLIQH